MISYLTLNDSTIVGKSTIIIGEQVLSLDHIEFGEFKTSQRKTILGIGLPGDIKPPSSCIPFGSEAISSSKTIMEVTQDASPYIDFGSSTTLVEGIIIPKGTYQIESNVWLDTPMACLDEAPLEKIDSIQYTQILYVEIIFSRAGCLKPSKKCPPAIYESFGSLGFFLADLSRMEKIISKELGDSPQNLVDAFSESELANSLFDAGVLCVTWGITPWAYYIYSTSSREEIEHLPFNRSNRRSGTYRISTDITELSLVPGNYLENWPACLKMQWPKINISGKGTTLKLDLHTRRFNSPNGRYGPLLAMFNIYRVDFEEEVSPLLNIDIESI